MSIVFTFQCKQVWFDIMNFASCTVRHINIS